MPGHGLFEEEKIYRYSSIRDNIQLLTPEVMDRINQEIVKAGHTIIGQKKSEELSGRCDSFVTKTDVHFPTDTNLLFDSVRKAIQTCAFLCTLYQVSGWRQSDFNVKKFKKLYRIIQKLRHSTAKNEDKKKQKRNPYENLMKIILNKPKFILEERKRHTIY